MYKSIFLMFIILGLTAMQAQTTGQMATYNSFSADGGVTDALLNYADGSISEKYSDNADYNNEFIQGSPYTSNSFSPTSLFYKDEPVGNVFYRYNALNEEVEIKKTNTEGENIRSLAKDKELNLRVNGQKMSFKTFITSDNRTTNGYLTELVNGEKYDLYKRTHVIFKEASAAKNSFAKAVPARFTSFTEIYMQKDGNSRIDEVLPKKAKLLNLLDDSKKAVTVQFLKDNDLNLKNEADMIRVFEFLNR